MVDQIQHLENGELDKSNNYIIKAYNLYKIYNPDLPSMVTALDNVTFGIEKGKVIAIAGPSGSGKSSLINILGCMDSATSGRAIIDGVDITKLSENELSDIRKNKIGFIFQDFLLIPTLSALDNVLLPLIPEGIKKADRERAMNILEQVGLENRASHKPKELSGGEKQRVAIARALINNPTIIFADEPTGNLDTKIGNEIIQLLRNLSEKTGVTVVIVSHDPMVWERTDLLLQLRDGRISNS
ncbi:MAG: ABC transporter ATP-binding protein [Candidatus Heimdallarchaeota archaeon]|nr:ABC transporter ATP-binding protein [Candidatus Heimdallarchaeota archaeon]MCG3253093.1 ABC transporter ATP-binding protein [Candidatus Heimdallarchaeota archaeon]MCK4290230.1 ABC transporter ATP-binding protein [Candidatus Heimdallarchaeota archaeon]